MICTSNYKEWETYSKAKPENIRELKPCSISGNKGVDAGYDGEYFGRLAPKKEFWTIWHNNKEKIQKGESELTELENDQYYIEQMYKQVLSGLNPEEIFFKLDGHVLLCYEDSDMFCHRAIVAAWLELFLGVEIPEVRFDGYGNIIRTQRLEYIKTYLSDLIRGSIDMRGYHTIRSAYLYEKSSMYDHMAKATLNDVYSRWANDYRRDADEIETQYFEEVEKLKNELRYRKRGY